MNWSDFFTADFEAGTLTWKTRPREHFIATRGWKVFNTRFAGTIAGSISRIKPYVAVGINGKLHKVHRIIWEMAHGPISAGKQIDHVDGRPSNNALLNLRLATNAQNCSNQGKRKNNTSGFKGVSWHKGTGKWMASISINGSLIYLGLFVEIEEAANAYATAAATHHGAFART